MNRIFFIIYTVVLNSCTSTEVQHANLISFESQFHRDLTITELENGGQVETGTNEFDYGDTIRIEVDIAQSGCMEFAGDILLQNDTLFLIYRSDNDITCDETVVYRFEYLIRKGSGLNYKSIVVRKED